MSILSRLNDDEILMAFREGEVAAAEGRLTTDFTLHHGADELNIWMCGYLGVSVASLLEEIKPDPDHDTPVRVEAYGKTFTLDIDRFPEPPGLGRTRSVPAEETPVSPLQGLGSVLSQIFARLNLSGFALKKP